MLGKRQGPEMSEKLKLSLGATISLVFGVFLTINIFHPLSYTSTTSIRNVGSGNQWIDVGIIIFCVYMGYSLLLRPHTIRVSGRDITFESFLNSRSIPALEIESLEKASFGTEIRFRYRKGNIKVNSSAVHYQLINDLRAVNPNAKIIGL